MGQPGRRRSFVILLVLFLAQALSGAGSGTAGDTKGARTDAPGVGPPAAGGEPLAELPGGKPLVEPQECGPGAQAPCPPPSESPAGASPKETLLAVGSPAPPFTLKDVEGKLLAFEPKPGKGATLLVFWSMFCEPCREELPLLDEMSARYSEKGLRVLSVNLDGQKLANAVARYRELNHFSFPVAMDEKVGKTYAVAGPYGVTGTPSLFLIGSVGAVQWRGAGRVDPEGFELEIRKALGP